MTRVASLKVAALEAEPGDQADRLREAIQSASTERNQLIDKARVVVASMELKGADPEVIKGYRQYLSGALAAEFKATGSRPRSARPSTGRPHGKAASASCSRRSASSAPWSSRGSSPA
jgi:hypothetical protein